MTRQAYPSYQLADHAIPSAVVYISRFSVTNDVDCVREVEVKRQLFKKVNTVAVILFLTY